MTVQERARTAFEGVKYIMGRVWIYVIIGVSIGGIFHGYAPEDILEKYAGKDNLLAVPMVILRKVLKKELIAIFVSIVALSIIFTGYLFNILL